MRSFFDVRRFILVVLAVLASFIVFVLRDHNFNYLFLYPASQLPFRHSASPVVPGLPSKLAVNVIQDVTAMLDEVEQQMQILKAFVVSKRWDELNLQPRATDPWSFIDSSNSLLYTMLREHPRLNSAGVAGLWLPAAGPPAFTADHNVRLFWAVHQALLVDVATGEGRPSLYRGACALSPDLTEGTTLITATDRQTGAPLYVLQNKTVPRSGLWAPSVSYGRPWDGDVVFNRHSGQAEFGRLEYAPARNDTLLELMVNMNVQTIADLLRAALQHHPSARAVLYNEGRPHGHMVAASHGRFFSHSDVDTRRVFPVDVSPFRRLTCLEATDRALQQACRALHQRHRSWAVPDGEYAVTVDGAPWSAAVARPPARFRLPWVLVLVAPRPEGAPSLVAGRGH